MLDLCYNQLQDWAFYENGKESVKPMGRFVNPDNSAFQVALNSKIYVDKTVLH